MAQALVSQQTETETETRQGVPYQELAMFSHLVSFEC